MARPGAIASGVTSGGNVALSADCSHIVWAQGGTTSVYVSTTFGRTWTAIAGLSAGAIVEADCANPSKFYAWSGNTFYTNTDKDLTFTPSAGSRQSKAMEGIFG